MFLTTSQSEENTRNNLRIFKAIYKEYVKNNDFLEDRHENKIKDLKKDFKKYLEINIKENLIDDRTVDDLDRF